jgi:5-methylcytosine-specific restriction protein B
MAGRPPVSEVLGRWLEKKGLSDEPARMLRALNALVDSEDIALGPSYFMTRDGTAPDLRRVWKHAILPLLEEHYYGTGRNVEEEFGLDAVRRRLAAADRRDSNEDAEDEPDAAAEEARSQS